jgi:hypothetical protein
MDPNKVPVPPTPEAWDAMVAERNHYKRVARDAAKLCRFVIRNRGCGCNVAGHRCGTNLMLADVAKIEEQIS